MDHYKYRTPPFRALCCWLFAMSLLSGSEWSTTVGAAAAEASRRCPFSCPHSSMFQCQQSCVCLEPEKVCDGNFWDCGLKDYSDETLDHCFSNSTEGGACDSPQEPFSCVSGGVSRCWRTTWLCDSHADCDDEADERHCDDVCPPNWFTCGGDDAKCIPEWMHCNGVADCEDDGEGGGPLDERDCLCHEVTMSTCKSYGAIGCGDWVRSVGECTGIFPCYQDHEAAERHGPLPDQFCLDSSHTTMESRCEEGGRYTFCKQGSMGRCLPRERVCDGISHCDDSSDEMNCASYSAADGESCYGACDHGCSVTGENRFECWCRAGFVLGDDRYSCLSNQTEAEPAVLVAAGRVLRALTLATSDARTWVEGGDERQRAGLAPSSPLALHVRAQLAFFADASAEHIVRYHIATTSYSSHPVPSPPGGLAVDWIHDLLFWTEPAEGRVMVSNLQFEKQQTIVSGVRHPSVVAAMPSRGVIFVVERVATGGEIVQYNMDGSGRQVVQSAYFLNSTSSLSDSENSIILPTGLALDHLNNRLYFCDNYGPRVAAIHLDRSPSDSRRLAILSPPSQYPNQRLSSLDLFNNKLYVSESRSRLVYEMFPLSARGDVKQPKILMTGHAVNMNISQATSLTIQILHSSRQPLADNHCKVSCSFLCLPTGESYRCICPPGHRLVSQSLCELIIEPFVLFSTANAIFKTNLPSPGEPLSNDSTSMFHPGPAADIDWHPKTNRIYWTGPHSIKSANYDATDEQTLVAGVAKPSGLAIDWVTNKVFWTDVEEKTISMAALDGPRAGVPTTIVWTDMVSAKYIALDLHNGYIYWSDSRQPYRIDRSRMDGSGRTTVKPIERGMKPSKLLFQHDIMYIVVGQEIAMVTDFSLRLFTLKKFCCEDDIETESFALMGREVFFTDQSNVVRKDVDTSDSEHQIVASADDPILALSVFHQDRIQRREEENVCSRGGGCEHMCLLASQGSKPMCSCFFGYQVHPENRSACVRRTDDVLLVRRGHSRVDVIFMNGSLVTQYPQQMPLPSGATVSQYEYSPGHYQLYYLDSRLKQISVRDLLTGAFNRSLLTGKTVNSFAIDETHELLYYVDEVWTMTVCDLRRCSVKKELIIPNSQRPVSLAVDPINGYLFWLDYPWNTSQSVRLMQSHMDGSNWRQIHQLEPDDNFSYQLAIDPTRRLLHWIGHQLTPFRLWYGGSASESGQFPAVADGILGAGTVGLAALNADRYWAERPTDRETMIRKNDFEDDLRGDGTSPGGKGYMVALFSTVEDVSTPPVTALKAFSHRTVVVNQCAGLNCSFMCAPSPEGGTCMCETGIWLEDDNQTCESFPRQFLLTPHSRMLPVSTSTDRGGTSPFSPPAKSAAHVFTCEKEPYPDSIRDALAIDFHYSKQLIFFATPSGIYTTNFNLEGSQRIADVGVLRDGWPVLDIAVDWIVENLYWLTPNQLQVSRLDGRHRHTLYNFHSYCETLHGSFAEHKQGTMALYPTKSIIFYSHCSKPGIIKADMSLSKRNQFWSADSASKNPDYLTIDYQSDQIFWVIRSQAFIYFSSVGELQVHTISSAAFTHPLALTVLANVSYCINLVTAAAAAGSDTTTAESQQQLSLTQCRITQLDDTPPTCSSVNDDCVNTVPTNSMRQSSIAALAFVSPYSQLPGVGKQNPCAVDNGGCSYLCLLSENKSDGFMCVCPDDLLSCRLDSDTSDSFVPDDDEYLNIHPMPPSNSHVAMEEQLQMVLIILVFVAAIVIVLIIGVLVCVRKHMKPPTTAGGPPPSLTATLGRPPPTAGYGHSRHNSMTTPMVHATLGGNTYHSLPRHAANRCSLTQDNYLLPANVQRYSTASLHRNPRHHAVPNNYVDIPQQQPLISPNHMPGANMYHSNLWHAVPVKNINIVKSMHGPGTMYPTIGRFVPSAAGAPHPIPLGTPPHSAGGILGMAAGQRSSLFFPIRGEGSLAGGEPTNSSNAGSRRSGSVCSSTTSTTAALAPSALATTSEPSPIVSAGSEQHRTDSCL